MLARDHNLSADRVRQLLDYDPLTGIFRWKDMPLGRRRLIGEIAGFPNQNGHWRIQIDGRTYQAHRVAWLYMTGVMPFEEVDHENLNRSDNRWTNLRLATHAQNMSNTRARANSCSGIKGVTEYPNGKWKAQIQANGKGHYLGMHETAEAAHAAYVEAAQRLHGEFARAA